MTLRPSEAQQQFGPSDEQKIKVIENALQQKAPHTAPFEKED